MEFIDSVETQVLVIGGGAAGMRAAIEAATHDVDVVLVTKGLAAKSGATPMACPSYQAAFAMEDDRDTPELAFEDTCFEGRYIGDENLIRALTYEATERALDMLKYGVKFQKKKDGHFLQVVHPGHSYERNLVIQGNGYAMASALRGEVRRQTRIRLLEDCIATKLLISGGSVVGLVALDMRRGSLLLLQAPVVILATGGYQELWLWTDTEPGLTGDGLHLAFETGADLVDLEMMLFYPTGLCYPPEVEGTLVQYEGLLTNQYCAGAMLNGLGEPFLPELKELPVRDLMVKFMFREIEEGRVGPHGGLFIDLRESPRSEDEIRGILHRLDSLPYDQLRDLGIDVLQEPIEVMPVTHYTLGGVRINEWGETTIPGLYAAGEVAGNIHGANRTSGNALAETQVFGARAGVRAAQYAQKTALSPVERTDLNAEKDRVAAFLAPKPHAIRPIVLKRKLKSIMHKSVHFRRDGRGLQSAIDGIRQMREEDLPRVQAVSDHRIFNYELEEALEISHMLEIAELVAASALAREESRGHHWRSDFPIIRRQWEKHTIVRRESDTSYVVTDAPVIRLKDRSRERRAFDPALFEDEVLASNNEE